MSGDLPIEVDVSEWPALEEEQLGSKPKLWLLRPIPHEPRNPGASEEAWLWKARTFNHDSAGRRFAKGDDWAEIVAAEVAERIGVPHAEVRLARRDEQLGVISLEMTMMLESLVHGNELLEEAGVSVSGTIERSAYTVDAVRRSLRDVEPPEDHITLTSAWDWFVGYLLLDAIVSNTDRHHENWGAIARWQGPPVLAPSFDHASSLGFAISDEERRERLSTPDRGRSVERYARRAKSKFAGRPKTTEVVEQAIALSPPEVVAEWRDRLAAVLDELPSAVDAIPESRMSKDARTFARAMIGLNGHRSLSLLSVP
ncbi:HipA domain-containing protein [Actinomarinicola tropica]|uniref:HipA-like C-terminal domain-containing protein n=1 Tax=Actinomarinicola tropica TaxID=2789776 RepID=A0A5Q2RC04_9ACTN|nr:HipA domain-containing protein [Actinomarinicola tropica]QGG94368.1 hypothetical protein GH723_04200 [Actinomarinicola tropica]